MNNLTATNKIYSVILAATDATIQYLSTGTLNASMNTSILGKLDVTGFTTFTDSSMNNLTATNKIYSVNLSATDATIQYLSSGTLNVSMNTSILGTLGVTGFTTLTDSSMNNLSVINQMSTINLSATNATIVNLTIQYEPTVTNTEPQTVSTITSFTNLLATNISSLNLSTINASINNLSVSNIYIRNTYPITDSLCIGNISSGTLNNTNVSHNASAISRLNLNSGVWFIRGNACISQVVNSWYSISISNISNEIDVTNENRIIM